ncbi:NAD-dependent deacetylase [Haloarcula vallismortis]|uniref:NAD-dependent protein deacetylase n=2 Tax=Haloarcula vallismortis TaxID=28442 RepID=M0JQB3_HALVA|nr:NAD-dependent protein deacylase [Haloarcula vallismortis]EMA10169.1 Sir2 family transcriptional regulator [Haloarcula vallismortis ATCC 29715]SDW96246.1 NAD-dependent deacetylase [Haloarcula vallismortis]
MAEDRHGIGNVDSETLDAVAEALRTAETAVALTGAGVSTASGIPSFRGDDGIWERHDPADFHRRRLDADPAGFWEDRLSLREAIYGDVDPEPNAAHEALATLESTGHIEAVLTQNVDGLHDAAGTDRVIELHGTHRRVVCDDCGHRRDAEAVFEAASGDGDLPPRCDCGGVYRPDVVLFGEPMPDVAMNEAQRLARDSDVFLAVGSSLSVRPASLLPKIAAEADSTLVVMNYEETPRDGSATHVLRADVTQVLPAIAERV